MRRSCITLWPTCVERYDWTTPIAPVTSEIAIIPPTSSLSSVKSTTTCFPLSVGLNAEEMTARSRNAGITPRPDEIRISTVTTVSFAQYGRNSRPIRRRFAWRTALSAGRSTGSRGENAPQ